MITSKAISLSITALSAVGIILTTIFGGRGRIPSSQPLPTVSAVVAPSSVNSQQETRPSKETIEQWKERSRVFINVEQLSTSLTSELLAQIEEWYNYLLSNVEPYIQFCITDTLSSYEKIKNIPIEILKLQKTLKDFKITSSQKLSQSFQEVLEAYKENEKNFLLVTFQIQGLQGFVNDLNQEFKDFQKIQAHVIQLIDERKNLVSQIKFEKEDLSEKELLNTQRIVDNIEEINKQISTYQKQHQTRYEFLQKVWAQLNLVDVVTAKTNYDQTLSRYLSLQQEVQELVEKSKKEDASL